MGVPPLLENRTWLGVGRRNQRHSRLIHQHRRMIRLLELGSFHSTPGLWNVSFLSCFLLGSPLMGIVFPLLRACEFVDLSAIHEELLFYFWRQCQAFVVRLPYPLVKVIKSLFLSLLAHKSHSFDHLCVQYILSDQNILMR